MPKATSKRPEAVEKAIATFEANEGVLRMADALRAGIHRNTLYAMLKEGVVLNRYAFTKTNAASTSTHCFAMPQSAA